MSLNKAAKNEGGSVGATERQKKIDAPLKKGMLKPSHHAFWITRMHHEQNGKIRYNNCMFTLIIDHMRRDSI